MEHTTETTWWLREREQTTGPFTTAYLLLRLRSGAVPAETLACASGDSHWRTLRTLPQFGNTITESPPPYAPPLVQVARPRHALPMLLVATRLYGLLVSPIIWLVWTILTVASGSSFVPESPLYALESLLTCCGIGVTLLSTGILFVGSLAIHERPRQCLPLVCAGLGLSLVWFVVSLMSSHVILMGASNEPSLHIAAASETSLLDYLSLLLLLLGLGALVFETVLLVCLLLNYRQLVTTGR